MNLIFKGYQIIFLKIVYNYNIPKKIKFFSTLKIFLDLKNIKKILS